MCDENLLNAPLTIRQLENTDETSEWLASLLGSYIIPLKLLDSSLTGFEKLLRAAFARENEPQEIFDADELADFYDTRVTHYARNWKSSYSVPQLKINPFQKIVDDIFSPQIKAVSFDVFDTLISRKSLSPFGVFHEVEKRILESSWNATFVSAISDTGLGDYCTCRRRAEDIARRDVAQIFGRQDCLFSEIIDSLGKILKNQSLADALGELEILVEHQFVEPRKIGLILYEAARQSQKPIFLLSDMYLPSSTIRSLLNKAGYPDEANILVSCEYGLNKGSGGLFVALMTKEDLAPSDILHIGDNIHGDYEVPKSIGIKANLILSRMTQWRRTFGAAYNIKGARNIEEELFYGAQARHIYDMPFPDGGILDAHSKKFPMFRGSANYLGYSVVGPLVVSACEWISRVSEANNLNKILFCARDGFIFYKIMQFLYPEKSENYKYLHVSRRTANLASLNNFSDIERVCSLRFSKCTLEELFLSRFGISLLSANNLSFLPSDQVSHDTDLSEVISVAKALEGKILRNADRARRNIKKLLTQHGIENIEEAAIFDLGYGGSIQRAIEKSLLGNFSAGIYFATFNSARSLNYTRSNIFVFTEKDIDPSATTIPFVQAVHVFETLFSHVDGSTVDYIERNDYVLPIFMRESGSAPKIDFMGLLWEGALSFARDYIQMGISPLPITWKEILQPFDSLVRNPHPVDLGMFADCSFENGFSGEPAAPLISSKNEEPWWKFGQKIYDKHNKIEFTQHTLAAVSNEGLEKMYIDYLERTVCKNFREKIAKLERKVSLYESLVSDQGDTAKTTLRDGLEIKITLPNEAPAWFDNQSYLLANPDVLAAVQAGGFTCGYEHYKQHGFSEGRRLKQK